MIHATAYSDLVHPSATRREPSTDEIAKVADAILPMLMASPAERLSALKESLGNCDYPALGIALLEGDHAEAGRIANDAANAQLTEDATELAERWLNDDLTNWDAERLANWRPVKYASLGRKYFLAELLG